jgi:phosphoenolpyruvate phosphomutase
MSVDLIHKGHLNIIHKGSELGRVVIGLLTDEAIASYKRVPFTSFEERKFIVENLKNVYKVIPQKKLDYVPNLKKLKPDYVVHGDDWKTGIQKPIRQKVIKTIKEWGGKLVKLNYTEGISSTELINSRKALGITPNDRMKSLRRIISAKPIYRFLESHNGITGLIVENTSYHVKGVNKEFDGIWISSLTDSTARGKPDTELVDFSSRFVIVEEILKQVH